MLAALKRSRKEVIAQIDGIVPRQGGGSFLEKRQTVEQFLHLLSLWLRDSLAVVSGRKEFVYNVDLMERLERFSAKFGTPAGLLSSLRSVDAAMRNTRLQLQLRPVLLTMMVEIEEALVQPS
jgi:hypothetical protein